MSFTKGLSVCATIATTAIFSSLFRSPPTVTLQEAPVLAMDDGSIELADLLGCMRFLDTRQTEWRVESSNFNKGGKADKSGSSEPKVEILRLDSTYSTKELDERPAPFMRVVGFFPNVLPQEVFHFMTDLRLRKEWDRNYHMFQKWEGDGNSTLETMDSLKRPIELVANKTPMCDGEKCLFSPDVTGRVVDYGWFAHRVGHSLLDKFGIADRLFLYKRQSVCYKKADCDDESMRMFDVLYSGSNDAVRTAVEKSETFSHWVDACVAEREAIRVSVNYQHILILPITNAEAQLWSDPTQLSLSGSMIDMKSTKSVYKTFIDSLRLYQDKKRIDGTLMIMTSANDARIPNSVPMWAQRMMASFFSNHAYRELSKSVLAHREKTTSS